MKFAYTYIMTNKGHTVLYTGCTNDLVRRVDEHKSHKHKGSFSDKYKPTILTDFSEKIHKYNGKEYKISLWDLAGQDKNAMVTKIFAKDAHGCVVMADATNAQTREE